MLSAAVVPMLEAQGGAAGELEAKQHEGEPDAGVIAGLPGEPMPAPGTAMPRLLEAGRGDADQPLLFPALAA